MQLLTQIIQAKSFKKIIILLFILLSAISWFGMWIYGHFYVSTDDAYVGAHIVQIAPRISGKVTQVYVNNNQYVYKDQLLFSLDDEPFKIAVESAKAQLAIAEAQLEKSSLAEKRAYTLVKTSYLPAQQGDDALANYKTAEGNVRLAKAALAQALLNLQYTRITAPVSGWLSNVTLRVGDVIPANQSLFALINDQQYWVDANFKETEMSELKPGLTATITTDLYPNHPFKGVIESISGGAGTAFALLPPQNATGNWVKVTQRIPVRVRILNPDKQFQLRVGISATVTINLKSNLHT